MPRPLSVVVFFLMYLPLVAVAVLTGYAFTWKLPVAWLLFLSVLIYRGRRARRWLLTAGRIRTIAEVLLFGVAGSVVGGVLFGALGVFMGFGLGLTMRRAEVPITQSRRARTPRVVHAFEAARPQPGRLLRESRRAAVAVRDRPAALAIVPTA